MSAAGNKVTEAAPAPQPAKFGRVEIQKINDLLNSRDVFRGMRGRVSTFDPAEQLGIAMWAGDQVAGQYRVAERDRRAAIIAIAVEEIDETLVAIDTKLAMLGYADDPAQPPLPLVPAS